MDVYANDDDTTRMVLTADEQIRIAALNAAIAQCTEREVRMWELTLRANAFADWIVDGGEIAKRPNTPAGTSINHW